MSKRRRGARRTARTRQSSDGLARPVEDSQKAYRFGSASAAHERLRAQVASTGASGNMGLRPKVVKHLRELKAQREKDHTHSYRPSKGCTWKCACGDTRTVCICEENCK